MSYRLIDSNAIAIKHPEVNDMPCIFVDLSNGLDNDYHIIDAPIRHGQWIYAPTEYDDNTWECSECGEPFTLIEGSPADNLMYYCPRCGAKMDEEE